MKVIVASFFVSLLAACGGGPTPSELSTPQVVIATRQAKKNLFYRDARLNLVKLIVPVQDDRLLILGNQVACTTHRSGRAESCVNLGVDLWDVDVLTDASGTPTTIVGGGGWGKPSVAVLDLNGTLKWRFDGGFDVMDTPVVAETPVGGVVVVGNRTFDLRTGAAVEVRSQVEELTAVLRGLMTQMSESAGRSVSDMASTLTGVVHELAGRVTRLSDDLAANMAEAGNKSSEAASRVVERASFGYAQEVARFWRSSRSQSQT